VGIFVLWGVTTGCSHLPNLSGMNLEGSKLRWTVALYEVANHRTQATGRLFRQLPTEDGKRVVVRAFPVFWSADFISARAYKTASGTPCIVFQLDRHGQFTWMRIRPEISRRPLAVVVGGIFRFMVTLDDNDAMRNGRLRIRGPWYATELREVPAAARRNYAKLHSQ